MGSTNFKNGLLVDGVPVGVPPIAGQYFNVCPGSNTIVGYGGKQIQGSSGNDGLSLLTAMDSINTAYNACTDGAGDGIILWSFGTSTAMTSSYLTAALAWAKSGITVVGIAAPSAWSSRARVTNASTVTTLPQIITVSGNNNIFSNVQFANFGSDATALGGMIVTGQRNYFKDCHIVGAGNNTPAQAAGAYSLYLNGAQENVFEGCVIGIDTVTASGNNANGVIQLGSGVERNWFKRCIVQSSYANSSTNGAVKWMGAGDAITRNVYFQDSIFSNYVAGDITSSPPGYVVVGTAPNNGVLVMMNCGFAGFGAWSNSSARVLVTNAAGAATGGIGTKG
jgi:hypothetical protein